MVFSSLDVIGVQVSAAMKNVIAIAFGVLDAHKEKTGAVFGDNTESLLLAAGLNEIQTLAVTLGATHPETFTSIAGVGDLDVTCRSQYGRNRRFGRAAALEGVLKPFSDIDELISRIDEIGYMPEGVVAARAVRELTTGLPLGLSPFSSRGSTLGPALGSSRKLPITDGVFRILNREVEPFDAIESIIQGLSRASFKGFLAHTEV